MVSYRNRLKETLQALAQGFKKRKSTSSTDTEDRIKELERRLEETRVRLNALIFLVLADVLEQIVMRLLR